MDDDFATTMSFSATEIDRNQQVIGKSVETEGVDFGLCTLIPGSRTLEGTSGCGDMWLHIEEQPPANVIGNITLRIQYTVHRHQVRLANEHIMQ